MSDTNYIYLRFPVQILRCEFYDIRKVCMDAIQYGVMEYMKERKYKGIEGFIRAIKELNITYGDWNSSDYSDQPKAAINYLKELHYSKCYHEQNERYNELKDSIETPITCSIKKSLLLDFLNKPKSEFDVAVFRFFIAINAIQGISKFGNATYDRVFATMFGYNTDRNIEIDGIKMAGLTSVEREIYLEYSTIKIRKKIINTLQNDYYLKWFPAGQRGNFYSFTIGRLALATIVETRKSNDRKRKNAFVGANKKAKELAVKNLKDKGLYH